MELERLASAKVNLFLHVGPVGADGYHPICSLVTFADVGDLVAIENSDHFGFEIAGPFAVGLDAAPDNLVMRAREAIETAFRPHWSPFTLTLIKRLPIAAGLGGGSADAAAAMKLMAARNGTNTDAGDKRLLMRLAVELGSDVPACLVGEPRMAEGRGERLSAPPAFPDLEAVLVNPIVPSPTGAVYRAYDDARAPGGADRPEWPDPMETPRALAEFLSRTRNDLEAPAVSLQPAIGQVLAALRARPETLFARMSGSGATCYALCAAESERQDLARAIADAHPDWWTQPCRLAGYRPR